MMPQIRREREQILRRDRYRGRMPDSLHFTEAQLTRRVKEMIATLVSGLNQCPY